MHIKCDAKYMCSCWFWNRLFWMEFKYILINPMFLQSAMLNQKTYGAYKMICMSVYHKQCIWSCSNSSRQVRNRIEVETKADPTLPKSLSGWRELFNYCFHDSYFSPCRFRKAWKTVWRNLLVSKRSCCSWKATPTNRNVDSAK